MEKKTTLQLKITHKDRDKELYLSADNMDELIDKIIDFQQWDNHSQQFFEDVDAEKKSGWYCFNYTTKLN